MFDLPHNIPLLLFIGMWELAGYYAFYKLLRMNDLVIVGPASVGYVIVSALLSLFFHGINGFYIVGGLAVIVGIWTVLKGRFEMNTAFWLVVLAVGWGTAMFLFSFVGDEPPSYLSIVSLPLIVFGLWKTGKLPTLPNMATVMLAGVFNSMATLIYKWALDMCDFLPVLFISSTYPLVVVMLGHFIKKEPFSLRQWVGTLMVVIGMILLGI